MMAQDEQTGTEGESTPSEPRSLKSKILGWCVELVVIVVGALIISALLRTFVGQMFIIPTGSMEDTLGIKDRVLVSKIGGFQRGDIVVFKDANTWMTIQPPERTPFGKVVEFVGLLPSTSANHLIKRVMGMPGDHVKCCDIQGRISVNGQSLDESAYLYADPNGVMVSPANVPFDIVVPKDHIFVMGDHRNASGDSRCHLSDVTQSGPPGSGAFIPTKDVVGSAVAIVSPLNRLRAFSVPEAFKEVPEPQQPIPEKPVLNVVNPGC